MLQNQKIMKTTFLSLIGIIGLCCITWVAFSSKITSDDPTDQTINPKNPPFQVASLNSNKYAIEQNNNQISNTTTEADNSVANTIAKHCSARCRSTLSILSDISEFDDQTFQNLERHVEEIATYLKHDKDQRQHLLQTALTTTDADKRAFISGIFKHLPYQQKSEIAEHYTESENWRVRADGVVLIANHEAKHSDRANKTLMNLSLIHI